MRLLGLVADLLYPPVCALCGTGCRGAVCAECEGRLRLFGDEVCRRCGAATNGRGCAECRGKEYGFARAVAAGPYEGALRDLLLSFKLGGRAYLAGDLGRRMADRALDGELPVDVVVPVPMRRGPVFRRGYNPAEELAVRVAAHLKRPFARALRKTRATLPQATLPLPERAKNPAGAYAVRRPSRVRSRSVLLVDDVLTTGATASECARVLLEAGAREVNLAVAAR